MLIVANYSVGIPVHAGTNAAAPKRRVPPRFSKNWSGDMGIKPMTSEPVSTAFYP